MAYDSDRYEERQAANDRSRAFARRDGETWTDQEDMILMTDWVGLAGKRDEAQIAKDLGRTIEACRNRAHFLAGVSAGIRYNKTNRSTPRPSWADEWEAETGGHLA